MEFIEIRKPDDFHLHLRQGPQLAAYVRATALVFSRALVMPNTLPPIDRPERVAAYRAEIEACAAQDPLTAAFKPLMSFKLLPGMVYDDVAALAKAGCLVGKYYPAGATTHSADGLSSPSQAQQALLAMEELGIPLCIHAELPEAFVLDRERAFLPIIEKLCVDYPRLKIVIEHISSAEGINALKNLPDRVAGTITVHHLLYSLDEVLGEGLNPHFFCKPCLKTPQDRQALQEAVLSGNPRLFFGSDSAPHLKEKKEGPFQAGGPYPPGGIFSAPAALGLLASFFEDADKLSRLENFVSVYGATYYGLPLNKEKIRLVKREEPVASEIGGAIPLLAGGALSFSIEHSPGVKA